MTLFRFQNSLTYLLFESNSANLAISDETAFIGRKIGESTDQPISTPEEGCERAYVCAD